MTETTPAPPPKSSVSELQFTRSRQAVISFALSMACLLAAVVLFLLNHNHLLYRSMTSNPPALGWAFVPLPFCALFAGIGWYHLRHPFLVVSRLGIEIHPIIPRDELDHITWVEIADADVCEFKGLLTITLNTEDKTKIYVTLKPIHPKSWPLLAEALDRIMDFRDEQASGVARA
jgi:hypothetical protein